MILKAFPIIFSYQNEPTKCPAKRKKNKAEKKKKRGGEKAKKKMKTAVSLLNLKTNSKFCFLHIPEL